MQHNQAARYRCSKAHKKGTTMTPLRRGMVVPGGGVELSCGPGEALWLREHGMIPITAAEEVGHQVEDFVLAERVE